MRNGDILKTSLTGLGGDWKRKTEKKGVKDDAKLSSTSSEETVAIYGDEATWVGGRDQELSTGHVQLETLQRPALALPIKQLGINNGNNIYIFFFFFQSLASQSPHRHSSPYHPWFIPLP